MGPGRPGPLAALPGPACRPLAGGPASQPARRDARPFYVITPIIRRLANAVFFCSVVSSPEKGGKEGNKKMESAKMERCSPLLGKCIVRCGAARAARAACSQADALTR